MRITILITAFCGLVSPQAAYACSILSPPVAATAEEIAARGMMIKGRVVQAFNYLSETSEVIEAEETYVGDNTLTNYVIYRTKSDFDAARKYVQPRKRSDGPVIACGPFFDHKVRVGETLDRLVLMPAPVINDPAARGRWVFHFWNGNVRRERGLDLLLEAADRNNRLLSRPPRDAYENCQQCAPALR